MNYYITIPYINKNSLNSVPLKKFIAYLKDHNWIVRTNHNDFDLYYKNSLYIKVISNKFADYYLRVYEALNILQEEEKRDKLLIINDIINNY